MILAVASNWLFSIVMAFTLKYIFNTSHSIYFCYEGYSDYWLNSVLFFIFLIAFSCLIPSILVILLYKRIIDKLKELSKNLHKENQLVSNETSNYLSILAKIKKKNIIATISSSIEKKKQEKENNLIGIKENKNPKQKRFAQQMVLINLLTCVGSVFLILTNVQVTLSTNPYFDYLNKLLQNVSPLFRVIFLSIQSAVPVISIVYSPWSYSWRDFKNKIKKSDFLTSSRVK